MMLRDDIMAAEELKGGEVAAAVRLNIIQHKISLEDGFNFLRSHGCHPRIACQLLRGAVEKIGYEVGG